MNDCAGCIIAFMADSTGASARRRIRQLAATAAVALVALTTSARIEPKRLPVGANGFRDAGIGGVRGVTIGPIESSLHPGKGYGSDAYARAVHEARRLGASWVSLTPFGRIWDLAPTGVELSFEAPFRENRDAVKAAVAQAHAAGLRVLLVPHLWVETGEWRALVDPGDAEAWRRWEDGYRKFALTWAKVAEEAQVDLLAIGVEMRAWATTTHAPSLAAIVRDVRKTYRGLLTYAANWDDAEDTVIWSELDVIGINAFFPLAEKDGAAFTELCDGGRNVATRVRDLATRWKKPVLFTEIGYTTRPDPAVRPWEWPDGMKGVRVDQTAQADAYAALLAPLLDEPWFVGFFVWRVYADPNDMSQEAEWGFSPKGKLAELVMRDAFAAHWAVDGGRPIGASLTRDRAFHVGRY
jgi:hypothetical protein